MQQKKWKKNFSNRKKIKKNSVKDFYLTKGPYLLTHESKKQGFCGFLFFLQNNIGTDKGLTFFSTFVNYTCFGDFLFSRKNNNGTLRYTSTLYIFLTSN